jgi:hypothetical protein
MKHPSDCIADLINAGVNLVREWLDVSKDKWDQYPTPAPLLPQARHSPYQLPILHTVSQPASPSPDQLCSTSDGQVASKAGEVMAEDCQVDLAQFPEASEGIGATCAASREAEELLKDGGWSLCALLTVVAAA